MDWEACLGSQHSSSCKPAPRRGFGLRRVCSASAQPELRTGSARGTCELWEPVSGGIFSSKGRTLKGLCPAGCYWVDGNTCGAARTWENPTAGPSPSQPTTPTPTFPGRDEPPRAGPSPAETVWVKHLGSAQPVCRGFGFGLFAGAAEVPFLFPSVTARRGQEAFEGGGFTKTPPLPASRCLPSGCSASRSPAAPRPHSLSVLALKPNDVSQGCLLYISIPAKAWRKGKSRDTRRSLACRDGSFQPHPMSLCSPMGPPPLPWECGGGAAPVWEDKAPQSQRKPFQPIPSPARWWDRTQLVLPRWSSPAGEPGGVWTLMHAGLGDEGTVSIPAPRRRLSALTAGQLGEATDRAAVLRARSGVLCRSNWA